MSAPQQRPRAPRQERAARAVPGLSSPRRPATADSPAFDLTYVRVGRGNGPVVLQIPGGPGMAVPLPYRSFRRDAAAAGFDVLMVEHRGVGLSRRDRSGQDLPPGAITIGAVLEDLVAVLDAEGIEQVIVSGASYGSYLAAALAVNHPDRLAGLVLDSTMLSANDHHAVRSYARALLWAGSTPGTAHLAAKIRTLVERDGHDEVQLGQVIVPIYEFGGPALLERYLDQLVVDRARSTTAMLRRLLTREIRTVLPHLVEFDLVAQIAYGELQFAPPPDGRIFDPAAGFIRADAPGYTGEPLDLPARLPAVTAPAVIIAGERDLRTPLSVGREAADLLPDGVLLALPDHGHSALDTRPGILRAALRAVADGTHQALPARAAELLATHRPAGSARVLPLALRALLTADLLRSPRGVRPRGLR
ncbi:MAG: alpha/beta fold hydrolase [Brachybacterium sp.]|nr:alpha/beta fold hydrolase [Brachybacterium sp.]